MIVDLDRAASSDQLSDAIECTRIHAGDLLLTRQIGPRGRRKQQQIAGGALFEKFAARFI